MGILTATIASAMTTGGAPSLPPPIMMEDKPQLGKLLSETMSLDRLLIHLTVQEIEISPALEAAIHSSILRSFEHKYYL